MALNQTSSSSPGLGGFTDAVATSDSNVISGIYINAAAGLAFLLLFCWLQTRSRHFYRFRTVSETVTVKPPDIPMNGIQKFWLWAKYTYMATDLDLLMSCGLDALVMTKIPVIGLQLFIPFSVMSLGVLLPVHFHSQWLNDAVGAVNTSGLTRLTLSAIEPGSKIMWLHTVFLWLYTFYALALLNHHLKQFARLRVWFLQHGDDLGYFAERMAAELRAREASAASKRQAWSYPHSAKSAANLQAQGSTSQPDLMPHPAGSAKREAGGKARASTVEVPAVWSTGSRALARKLEGLLQVMEGVRIRAAQLADVRKKVHGPLKSDVAALMARPPGAHVKDFDTPRRKGGCLPACLPKPVPFDVAMQRPMFSWHKAARYAAAAATRGLPMDRFECASEKALYSGPILPSTAESYHVPVIESGLESAPGAVTAVSKPTESPVELQPTLTMAAEKASTVALSTSAAAAALPISAAAAEALSTSAAAALEISAAAEVVPTGAMAATAAAASAGLLPETPVAATEITIEISELASDPAPGLALDPASELASDPAPGLASDPAPGLASDPAPGPALDSAPVLALDPVLDPAATAAAVEKTLPGGVAGTAAASIAEGAVWEGKEHVSVRLQAPSDTVQGMQRSPEHHRGVSEGGLRVKHPLLSMFGTLRRAFTDLAENTTLHLVGQGKIDNSTHAELEATAPFIFLERPSARYLTTMLVPGQHRTYRGAASGPRPTYTWHHQPWSDLDGLDAPHLRAVQVQRYAVLVRDVLVAPFASPEEPSNELESREINEVVGLTQGSSPIWLDANVHLSRPAVMLRSSNFFGFVMQVLARMNLILFPNYGTQAELEHEGWEHARAVQQAQEAAAAAAAQAFAISAGPGDVEMTGAPAGPSLMGTSPPGVLTFGSETIDAAASGSKEISTHGLPMTGFLRQSSTTTLEVRHSLQPVTWQQPSLRRRVPHNSASDQDAHSNPSISKHAVSCHADTGMQADRSSQRGTMSSASEPGLGLGQRLGVGAGTNLQDGIRPNSSHQGTIAFNGSQQHGMRPRIIQTDGTRKNICQNDGGGHTDQHGGTGLGIDGEKAHLDSRHASTEFKHKHGSDQHGGTTALVSLTINKDAAFGSIHISPAPITTAAQRWDVARAAVWSGRVSHLRADPAYCPVAAFYTALFPQDFDRAIPVLDYRRIHLLLRFWNFHMSGLDSAVQWLARLASKTKTASKRPWHIPCYMGVVQTFTVDSVDYLTEVVLRIQCAILRQRTAMQRGDVPTGVFLVLFKTQAAAALAAAPSSVHCEETDTFHVCPAPAPTDINWQVLLSSVTMRKVMPWVMLLPTILTVLFPVTAFSSMFMQLDYVFCPSSAGSLPQLGLAYPPSPPGQDPWSWPWYCNQGDTIAWVLRKVIIGWAPAGLLALWTSMILPNAFHGLAQQTQRYLSLHGLDIAICDLYWWFNTTNVFISGMLGASFMQQINRDLFTRGLNGFLESLGVALPGSSNFYINYLSHSAMFGFGLKLMLPHGGVTGYLFKKNVRVWRTWSARERCFELYTCRSIRFGAEFGQLLLAFVLGCAFALVSPVVPAMSVLYFTCAYFVLKYQLLYIYVRKYESGGMFAPMLINRLFACVLIMVLFTCAALLAKRAVIPAWLTLGLLPAIVILFWKRSWLQYEPVLGGRVPLGIAAQAPPASVDPSLYAHPSLHPRALGWHPDMHMVYGGIGLWGQL